MGRCCKCGRETKNEVTYYARNPADGEWQERSTHYCAKCGYLGGIIFFMTLFLFYGVMEFMRGESVVLFGHSYPFLARLPWLFVALSIFWLYRIVVDKVPKDSENVAKAVVKVLQKNNQDKAFLTPKQYRKLK